ncbi:BsuBI/PstI family type II restriction endonuclease [Paenibacillus sp. NPDC058177]|uniref:BsuBI/PstI family type II restriction endonuclease n=1 Tax=Paenibacillus sp. NPDC058177 TaxID=3346369 RepID=UPI0036DED365
MLTIGTVKEILQRVGFPEQNCTDTTAICIIALQDRKPRQGLILGHQCLAEGARITDILEFARNDLGKNYAENSREAVRKYSLKYLVDFGLVHVNKDDPTRPVNSGNTNYTLVKEFKDLLKTYKDPSLFSNKIQSFVNEAAINRKKYLKSLENHNIQIEVPFMLSQPLLLSPGDHNIIEKLIVDELFAEDARKTYLVYLGDTKNKKKYINKELVKKIRVSVDEHAKLPDVIGFDAFNEEVMVFEAVASSGPVDFLRKKELEILFARCPYPLRMSTVFLKRSVFQKFSNNIAPGTSAYIAETKMKVVYETF